MFFTSAVVAVAAATLVVAQDQIIDVGSTQDAPGGIFQFKPNSIAAKNGSVITFRFSGIPGNHSVTQSSFATPCQEIAGGFDSGWVQILVNQTDLPTWNLTITNDQTPIWFYCKQLAPMPHCFQGMVGAINVQPGPNSFGAFQSKAVVPSGTPDQDENGLVGVGASASAEPIVPTPATHIVGAAAASATAPAGSNSASAPSGNNPASASGPSGSSSGTSQPGAAVALGINTNLLVTVVLCVFAGAVMVL